MWTQETNLFTSDLTTIRALCLLQETSWSHWCCPPRFVKDACETKGPIILMIINSTLSAGVVPTTLKHAILQPLIKRQKSWNKLYSWSCNLRSPSGVPQEFLRSPSGVPQESLRSSSGVPQESLRSSSGVYSRTYDVFLPASSPGVCLQKYSISFLVSVPAQDVLLGRCRLS